MEVLRERVLEADEKRGAVYYVKSYLKPEGLEIRQTRRFLRESDYVNEIEERISSDNGRTYTEWKLLEGKTFSVQYGEDELIEDKTAPVWNPVHKHYVFTWWNRYFVDGHKKSYEMLWQHGKSTFFDHQYIAVSDSGDGTAVSKKMIKYEDGADFNPEYPDNPEFLRKNEGFINPPIVLKNGDIAVPVGIPIPVACRMAGLDVNEVFPSCPHLHRAVIVARGVYNPEEKQYDFTFSNPIILDDLRSSRGIDEPILSELESGRILLIMRGSNVKSIPWNTRIADGTPTYKWYAYSDDGAKTFTAAEPWKFNTGEPIYSAATISSFVRSFKTNKLYWIGNISDEKAYGNFPRFPLYICEVDDETALLKKETLTVVDTRRDGDSPKVQFSNFAVFEDRESGNIEIELAKIGQVDPSRPFICESWKYTVIL